MKNNLFRIWISLFLITKLMSKGDMASSLFFIKKYKKCDGKYTNIH